MKKCPYCGHGNDDKTEVCVNCCAGFPKETKQEEPKHEEEETVHVTRRKTRS